MSKIYKTAKPVVDVRKGPKQKSELINQLLFNEVVTKERASGEYLRIESRDCYEGWVKRDHLAPATRERHSYFVDMPTVTLFDDDGSLIGRLSFGTQFTVIGQRENFLRLDFDGRDAWISEGCVRKISPGKAKWRTVKQYLELFVGTPYVWGGRSGFGLDCSGLVQLVFNTLGYKLPRDSADQRRKGHRVSLDKMKPGDLIFSPGHVCVCYEKSWIIHSSAKAGGVYIERSDDRPDIFDSVELVKRII